MCMKSFVEERVRNVYLTEIFTSHPYYKTGWDLPGGAVVKNPPASAGDTGSSPGPGRSHVLQSN